VDSHNIRTLVIRRAFQDAISSVIEEELLGKIHDSFKFSLMLDESTEISIHQNLIMCIRRYDVDIVEPHTYFFGIDLLAYAESIYSKVTCILGQEGTDMSKLCGLLLKKKEVLGALATHCIAHMIGLSCCSGTDYTPYLVKYFHNSPKNTTMFEAIQSITPGQSGKFKEMFHTRKLSVHGSVETCILNFSSVVTVFIEEKSPSLYKPIITYKFLCSSLTGYSVKTDDIEFSEFNPLLATAVQTIEKVRGLVWSPINAVFKQRHGYIIRDANKQQREAVSICETFSAGVISSMHGQFADNDDGSILTSMFFVVG
ncbi:LOW QUALITY PROTEIN: hypothetical protein MAR_037335, partial [Mya arenaria]